LGLIKEKTKEETIMATKKADIRLCCLFGILGLFLFTPIVQAQTPFDVTECGSGTSTVVYQSKETSISGMDVKGIFFSHHENKVFNNCTFHVVGLAKIEDGKRRVDAYWKIMDPDGDIIITELVILGPEKTMKFLHGTGKWKGIKGEAKGKTSAIGMIVPGTFQACSRYVGTFELAK
jgi:hypothetical protein